jgi:hypothetical protein
MVGAWHGRGMASVNQTRPDCLNQIGKTHSKSLAARHGRGMAWVWHGHGMLCVNRPYEFTRQYLQILSIPVAVQFKVWVCGLSLTGILGSNSVGAWMPLLSVLCHR